MEWSTLLLNLIFTAVIYLFVPTILCLTCRGKLSSKQILTITIVNGAVLWLIFMIIRINAREDGSSAAVVLWSSIAYWLLRKNCLKTSNNDSKYKKQERVILEYVLKKCEEFKDNKETLTDFLDLCVEERYISAPQYRALLKKYNVIISESIEKDDDIRICVSPAETPITEKSICHTALEEPDVEKIISEINYTPPKW